MANVGIEKALHSNGPTGFGLSHEGHLINYGRFVDGFAAVSKVARYYDDFVGDLLADEWNVVEGADTATSGAIVTATSDCPGAVVLTTGDSSTLTYAGNGIQITQGAFYNWKAANGGLYAEFRLKISAITAAGFFVGFTDLGTFEAPIESSTSGNGITTNATDAVGFLFDTRMTDDNIWLVGVKNGTDATSQDTGIAPVADTYLVLGVAVDKNGDAVFYINGARVGTVLADAITTTVPLTLTIAAASFVESTAHTVTVDYIAAEMHRV